MALRHSSMFLLAILLVLSNCEAKSNFLQDTSDIATDPINYIQMVENFMHSISSEKESNKNNWNDFIQLLKQTDENVFNKTQPIFKKRKIDMSDLVQTLSLSDLFLDEFDFPSDSNDSQCYLDVMRLFNSVKLSELWALNFLDSWGKPQPGLFGGATKWPGDYETCLTASSTPLPDQKRVFHGQYCDSYVVVLLPDEKWKAFTIQLGSCIPDSCSNIDWEFVLNTTAEMIQSTYRVNISASSYCHPKWGSIPLSKGAVAMIVILSLFGAIIITGTVVDLWCNTKLLRYFDSVQSSEKSQSRMDLLEESGETSEENVQDEATESSIQDYSPPSSYSSGSPPWQPNDDQVIGRIEFSELPLVVKIFCAFSVYRNFQKLFNVSSCNNSGILHCVHGMRFLSMCWIILGHTYFFSIYNNNNVVSFTAKVFNSKPFSLIMNGELSVDTFFFLSGLLTAYLFYKAVENNGGPFPSLNFWEMFYFHRFFRLTPPYMLFMGAYTTLFIYLWQGPFWPSDKVGLDQFCESNWWTNLLYINNIVHSKQMCMGWSWYLANDMQFYFISPLLMVPLYYSQIAGATLHVVFLIGTLLATGLISSYNGLGPNGYDVNGGGFDLIYIKPWCRFAPYVIGLAVGYVLYKTKCKVKMNKVVVLTGWIFSLSLSLAMVYSLYPAQHNKLSPAVAALFNSTNRVGWSVSLAWIVFACCTGYGGIIDRILSWPVFIPLSRLTYCAYLVHPIVMLFFYLSMDASVMLTQTTAVLFFLGFILSSYGVAFIVSMMFEAPLLELEKILLKKI